MGIIKMCANCKYQKTTNPAIKCGPCDSFYSNWKREDESINPNELITELNTKLYSEQELTHMSNRDAITGEAVNKVVGELIDWVNGKL